MDKICANCGNPLEDGESVCLYCGTPIPEELLSDNGAAEEAPVVLETDNPTASIAHLKAWFDANYVIYNVHAPKFSVGKNANSWNSWGIYKTGDTVVIYENLVKNKRTIWYEGPDELAAVEAFYLKICDEMNYQRDIYEGKIPVVEKNVTNITFDNLVNDPNNRIRDTRLEAADVASIFKIFVLVVIFAAIFIGIYMATNGCAGCGAGFLSSDIQDLIQK